jgi:hypothetical protein
MGANLFITTIIAVSALLAGCLPSEETGQSTDVASSQGAPNPDFEVRPDPVAPPVLPEIPAVPPQVPVDEDGLIVNGGEVLTNNSELQLTLQKFEGLEMKISLNRTCSDGQWEPYETSRVLGLSDNQKNRLVKVSVTYKDYDQFQSPCYSAEILHDDKAPDILFTKYPVASLRDNEATEVIYEVTDSGVGVRSVVCRLNGIERPCTEGRTVVTIPGAAPGTYIFEVVATDNFGFSSERAISWQVLENARRVQHTINVDEYRKWDILFVIDNSGSMAFEQRSMAERTRNFLSVMRGLDWQIAVTTTDPRDTRLGDGRFIPLAAGSGSILRSSMNEVDAQTILSNTLQRPEVGSGLEQGIRSTYRVVERAATPGSEQAAFFREGAHFAVVLISDEDESANTFRNDPQSLADLVTNQFKGQKNFSFNSIIAVPGDINCINGEGATYGERYKMITELTRGVMGSVCESDYGSLVTGIAEQVRGMAKSFTLSCEPLVEYGIVIKRDGAVVTDAYTLDGVKINFANSIEPGSYELEYSCLR